MKTDNKIIAFLKPYMKGIYAAIFLGVIGSVMNLFIPDEIKKISNIIYEGMDTGIDMNKIVFHAVLSVVMIVLVFILNLYSGRKMAGYGRQVGRDISIGINAKINRLPISIMDSINDGDLIAAGSTDVNNIGAVISRVLAPFVSNCILFVGSAVMMYSYSALLATVVILTVLLGTLVSALITKKSGPLMKEQRAKQAYMNAQIGEALTGHMIIKAFNAEDETLNAFNENNNQMRETLRKSQFMNGILAPFMTFVNNLAYVLISVVGAYLLLYKKSDIGLGVIVAFILYARMFSTPVSAIAGYISQIMTGNVSAGKIMNILEYDEMDDEGNTDVLDVKGRVVFDHVRFGYSEDKEIIHDFSAVIEPSMKVAIVGPTGAGKSTLVNLLMRFYDVNSGNISIDGVRLEDIKRSRLHSILGMVLQDTWIFEGSIRDNIIYSTENVSDERLSEVIKECGLDHLISTLPDGLDTILSENSTVSAGQKQLITIARAMIRNPEIMILDEATSSVDTRTEKLIQTALDQLSQNRTSFVIAHRLSTIQNADLILVLDQGDIVEMGRHEELLKKGGLYSELYKSQFDNND